MHYLSVKRILEYGVRTHLRTKKKTIAFKEKLFNITFFPVFSIFERL